MLNLFIVPDFTNDFYSTWIIFSGPENLVEYIFTEFINDFLGPEILWDATEQDFIIDNLIYQMYNA